MTEELKKAKAVRVSKKSTFTRKKNHLQQLLDGGATVEKLKASYDELAEAFSNLEKANEDVLIALEEDQVEAEAAYLDGTARELAEMDVKVSTSQETQKQQQLQEQADADKAEAKRKFEGAIATLRTKIEGFGKPSANLLELTRDKRISFVDIRQEIQKLEESQAKLLEERGKVVDLDPSADVSGLADMFNNMVVVEVDLCKRIAHEYLK